MVKFEELDSDQQEVCTTLDDNLLVEAGPGAGKSLILVHRFNKLVEDDVDPEQIVLTTFGREASEEIKDRIQIDQEEHDLNIGTIHSLCYHMVKDSWEETAYSSKPTDVLNDYNREKFIVDPIKEVVEEEFSHFGAKSNLIDDAVTVALANIDKNRRELKMPDEAEGGLDCISHDDKRKINHKNKVKELMEDHIGEIYEKYRNKLEKENKIDYGAMTFRAYHLLKNNENVRKQYDYLYEYIMVDEAQDTNPLQYNIIDLLSQETENLMLVGDSSQSIYSFRSASYELMQKFQKDYDAKQILLQTNYRSTSPIVDVVNKLNNDLDGVEKKIMNSAKGNSEKSEGYPKVQEADAAEVANEIKRNITEDNYSLDQIAILVRTNRFCYQYQAELEKRGIPTRNLAGPDFTQLNDVQGAYGYVRMAEKGDGPGMEAYLDGYRNVWRNNIEQMKEEADNLFEYVKDLSINNDYISKKKMRKINDDMDFLEKVEEDDYPFEKLMETKFRKGRTDNIEALQEAYQTMSQEDFFAFMDVDREEQAVEVSTVHAAKGKEWDVVFVSEVNDGDFPHEDTEEEKRVFYVACSRPDERLYVTYNPGEDPSDFVTWLAS